MEDREGEKKKKGAVDLYVYIKYIMYLFVIRKNESKVTWEWCHRVGGEKTPGLGRPTEPCLGSCIVVLFGNLLTFCN